MINDLKLRLPEPGDAREKRIVVEKRAEALISPAPSRRRRFLGGMAASAAAMIGGCSRGPVSEETFTQWVERIGVSGRTYLAKARREYDDWKAEDWLSRSGKETRSIILPDESDYATFLTGLSLRHIRPHEVIRPHRNVRGGVANELPPKNLWNKMVPTLHIADKIRDRLGSRLNYINSAYRSPAYNAKCSGAASQSYHMQNCALDLMFDAGPEAAFAMAKTLRSEGAFNGGIGLYDSFIHIDTRGYSSTWGVA